MKKTIIARNYSTSSYILPLPVAKPVTTTKQLSADEAEYEAWKKANGLDRRLSRQEYETVFGIYA